MTTTDTEKQNINNYNELNVAVTDLQNSCGKLMNWNECNATHR